MRLRTILLVLVSFWASAALAQTVTMGNEYVPYSGWGGCAVTGVTYVDLVHPATAAGAVTDATFAYPTWADTCPGAVTIKFFRRLGDKLSVFAERGPFDVSEVSELTRVTLSPPVRVFAGDLIGVTVIEPNPCGGCLGLSDVPGGEYLAYPSDINGMVSVSAAQQAKGTIGVSAYGDTPIEYTALVIPVVGCTIGSNGSQWRTSLQMLNPNTVPATGRLVFRCARAAAGDASLPYSIPAGATQTIPDVVGAMGRTGHLGSIDVVTTYDNAAPPVVVAHIVHDRGDGSAVGMAEEAIDPWVAWECPGSAGTHVLQAGVTAHLVAPAAGADKRFNIGVRALEDGATMNLIVHAADGAALQTVPRTYDANYFEQLTAEELFGGLVGGESIEIEVLQGSAIVYGTMIDNATNDPAIQFAEGVGVRETE